MTTPSHLRLAGLPPAEQSAILAGFIADEPVLMDVLTGLRDLAIPEGMLVAGAIYNLAWNRLTDRPPLNGINDLDVFYYDASDLSYEAEDAVIRRLAERFAHLPLPVQVRNQARVHLWFPEKFGITDFAPLASAEEMLGRYASKTHAVAARLTSAGDIDIRAPFGLEPIFGFRVVPNRALANNRKAHDAKGARAKSVWPELTVLDWDDPSA